MPTPAARESAEAVYVTHPNRDKSIVQGTRATVVLLLLASAALMLVITVGGWKVSEGAVGFQIVYVLVYLTIAFFAARWNRGVLPVAAALAVLLGTFALVSASSWFDRNKSGFTQPLLNSGVLGILTLLVIPVQILLVAFAMRGFSQGWNVEVEHYETPPPARGGHGAAAPHPA
jgi:presenilin-like A22 family membrane protease